MNRQIRSEQMKLVVRYLLIGGVTFCAYFVLLYLFTGILHFAYPTSVAIAYGSALVIHFSANRTFTFRSKTKGFTGHIVRYSITALLNYALQVLLIFILYQVVNMNFYLAALAAVLLNLVVGFVLQHRWVFAVPRV